MREDDVLRGRCDLCVSRGSARFCGEPARDGRCNTAGHSTFVVRLARWNATRPSQAGRPCCWENQVEAGTSQESW